MLAATPLTLWWTNHRVTLELALPPELTRVADRYARSLSGRNPVGGVKLFPCPTPQEQCILVRLDENSYVAYSQKCTHLSCAVFHGHSSRWCSGA